MRSHGFSLIEAIVAIVILGLIAPVSMVTLRDAAASRGESIQLTRAVWLANAVMETALGDVASADDTLGFEALENGNAYLNTPITGLMARLGETSDFYAGLGFTWTLGVGGLVGSTGAATGDEELDIYRVVTVTVSWVGAARGSKNFELSALVCDVRS